jgi:large subunit ribosomal protein LP0
LPVGNVGFIFTNNDLKEIRGKILANKVAAPARAGAVAPADVFVPAGNTGMEPGKTSFFQALGVPTKIARGTIEITTDLKLVEAGHKVGASEATLLNMLNISPFTYGMSIMQVYEEGQTFSPDVLDIEPSQLLKVLSTAIATITTISLAANYPTLPSVMHSLINSYKNAISVAIETDYSWEAIDELKDRIANPDAYAAVAPAAGAAEASAPEAAAEEKKEESEKEESEDEGRANPMYWEVGSFTANANQGSAVSSISGEGKTIPGLDMLVTQISYDWLKKKCLDNDSYFRAVHPFLVERDLCEQCHTLWSEGFACECVSPFPNPFSTSSIWRWMINF